MKLKRIMAMVLCVAMVLSTMGTAVFAEEPENTDRGYHLCIYNADGTVGMDIDGTKSASDFCLRSAIEDARVFVDNAFLFGITTPATYVVEMYEDSVENKSFEIGSDVTINGNGHNIILEEGVELTNNGTINNATIVEKSSEPAAPAVAEVNSEKFTDIQAAIVAAAPSGTVTLLKDVTVDKWIMISENLSIGDGTVITLDMDGLTIDGAGHTLTVNDIESAGNGNHLFYDGDYNISNLTLNMATNVNGLGITSGSIENVTFIGGCGISGGAAVHVSDGLITGVHAGNVTIEGCTFKNNGGAIYSETAQNGLVVKNNTFEVPSEANIILLRGTEQFTNNTVNSGRTVNVVSGSPVVTGNNFGDVRLKVYNDATATIEGNTINNLVFNDESEAKSTFTNNTLSETAQSALDAVSPAAPAVAEVNGVPYTDIQAALTATQDGDEIVLLADVEGDITVPAGVIFNGNGFAVSGGIIADGNITFAGLTKAKDFDVNFVGTTINIGKGASLQLTGADRLVVGHGCTFNIEGNIVDAKTANVADITPSLIMPGASFTGAGVNFNVKNAYISVPSSYCSSSKSASGTFNFNIENSIWEVATNKLAFEAQSVEATVNFNLKDSVINTGTHLIFGVDKGEIVIDNSNVNVGTSRQLENRSTMTIKNGSVVNGAVATSSNAINPGTVIVENATYAVTGQFSGASVGTGTLVIKKGAIVSVGSIVDKANIVVDATDMAAGDTVNITANLSNFGGTISVINNNLEATIKDGKIVLVKKPAAKIGDVEYATFEDAVANIKLDGSDTTIKLLRDIDTTVSTEFKYGKGNVIFTADEPVTVRQTALGTDWAFTTGNDMKVIVDENVTFEIYDNASGMYLYYGPSLELKGAITGGQNWGSLYLYNGSHTVAETGKVNVGRVQLGFNSTEVKGEVDTNYLLVEGATFIADGAKIDANVIYDNNNGGQRWGASEFIIKNGSEVKTSKLTLSYADSEFAIDATSSLVADKVVGAGKIVIDASAFAGNDVEVITADMSGFTGTIEVINNDSADYKIENGKVYIVSKKVAIVTDANGNVTSYADIESALKALTSGATLTLLSDITVDYYWDARYTGAKIEVPVTIDGNGKTLKFTNTVYDGGNQYSAFRFEAPATVKNLTIDMTDAISGFGGRFRAISSKDDLTVDNCTFIGNGSANNTRAIIFGEGAGSAIGDVEVSITNSTFTGWRRGVSDNENAQDAKSVVITKNTFTDAEVAVSATDVITFTDNTVTGKYVKITSYTKAENLVVTATGNTLTANVDDSNMNFIEVASKNITAQEEFYIPSDAVAKIGDVEYATLQAAIDVAVSGDTITLLADAVGDVTVAADDNLVLDLNGFDIVGEMTGITNNGTLIINDSVGTGNVYTSDVSAQGRATIQNYGNITINGGWFGDSNNDMSDRNAINRGNAVKNYGTAVINGGYFTNVSNQYIGTDAYAYAINTLTSGTTTINNATVYGDINGLIYSDGTTIVKDGSYTLGRPNEENNLWYLAYGNVEIHGGTWTRAFKVPSWNTADPTFNGNVKASGGIFNVNIEAYVAQGYAAIKNLDGNYVVGTKPTATVNNEGMQTIVAGEYGIWDGSFYKGTDDMPLSFVMQFIADQTGEDMATSPYADWYADFVLTFDGLENDSFDTTGCYLAGYYGEFGWIKVPVEGILDSIEEGVRYPVMLGVGLGQKYDYVCSGVQDFKCALYLTPEILEANPNLTVNLELAVVDSSKGSDEAAAALVNNENTYKVVDYTYDRDDFVVANYVAQVGETKYATLDEAIAVGGDVVLLADVELANTITVNKDVSLDLNGYTISGACNASQAHMFMVNNGAQMTIKDSSDAETGKITYNGTNATGWIVDVEGKLVLESGTLELTGTWSIGYAVDVRPNAWGSAYTEATSFVMNGGKIVSSDGGVRVASSSSETYSDISASFTMNGGEIDAAWDGVFVQQSNAVWDVLSFIMNGGTIKSGLNPVRFYGPAATSYVNGEDCVDIVFNGGILAYTGTEERTWLVENILRLGGEVTEDEFLKDSTVTASASFAETNVAEGYKWVESDGVYTLEKVKLFNIYNLTVSLDSSLALNIYYNSANFTGEEYYAEIKRTKADGTDVITNIPYADWVTSGKNKAIRYTGVAAKEMADRIAITIYNKDGIQVSETYETSLRDYAIGSLKQYSTNSAYAKYLPVYIDMLNYGAAAQKKFGYNLDNLANADTEEFQQYASQTPTIEDKEWQFDESLYSITVSLENTLELNTYFKTVTEDMYAKYLYTTHAGTPIEETVCYDSFIKRWGKLGVAVPVAIADAATLITVTLYNGDDTVVGKVVYSIDGYLKGMMKTEEDDIYPALTTFAASAKKAFAKNN